MTQYIGSELALFAGAVHWKKYWGRKLQPWVRGRVLDVGAGIGSSIEPLANPAVTHWTCLEPDPDLTDQISTPVGFPVDIRNGVLADIDTRFDTLVYIDVLEHIEADRTEVELAADRLEPGGHLVVLAPAHMRLFSPWDASIGHFRRYNRESLTGLTVPSLSLVSSFYLDSVGMLASFANRLLLQQTEPSVKQIAFWDQVMVPCSQLLDPLTGYRLGKTVIAVWRKTG